jgi:hypothetical protein
MAKDCHCVAELYQLFVAHQATSSNSSSSSGISKASGTIAILSGVMVFGLPPLSSISRSLFNLSATAISRKSDAPLNTRRLCVDYPFISLFARFVSSMPVWNNLRHRSLRDCLSGTCHDTKAFPKAS